jgi:putative ABC transport system permease protein
VDTVFQDIRVGWRLLARQPGFAVIALLTLALGIGANTGVHGREHRALAAAPLCRQRRAAARERAAPIREVVLLPVDNEGREIQAS